jgi:hypothetical protein
MISHTPQSDALLKDYWCNSTLTSSEIARKMGAGWTKNTVIGRAHNLDLPKRGNPSVRKPELRARIAAMSAEGKAVVVIAKEIGISSEKVRGFIQREEAHRKANSIPAPTPALPAVETPRMATIKTVRQVEMRLLPASPHRRCQYIAGDKPYRFCGKPAVPGKSWCESCMRIVFRPRGEKEAA